MYMYTCNSLNFISFENMFHMFEYYEANMMQYKTLGFIILFIFFSWHIIYILIYLKVNK